MNDSRAVDLTTDGRVRRAVSPLRFIQLATVTVFTLWVVVTSGAVVRLTASGLGCDNWPQCGDKPFPEKGGHAAIEFGNRMVALVGIVLTVTTWLASRRVDGLPRRVRTVALVTALGTVAQIPLGGITVLLDLHPVAVMSHFLLALLVLAGAVIVALEAWIHRRGLAPPAGPPWLRAVAGIGVLACAVLVATGTTATASGPHSGGQDIRRIGVAVTDAVYVHVRATAVFGIGLLVVGFFLWRLRAELPGIARSAGVLARRARAPARGRRGAVPQCPALVARPDPRVARGDDLGVDGRDRLLVAPARRPSRRGRPTLGRSVRRGVAGTRECPRRLGDEG